MEKQKKYKRTIAVLAVLVVVLLICAAGLGYFVLYLTNNNVFSKNIMLDSTWLLEDIGDGALVAELPDGSTAYFGDYSGTYADVAAAYEAIGAAEAVYFSEVSGFQTDIGSFVLDVPFISQTQAGLPNGCEAVCAAMLMQYNGLNIDAATFVDSYLPCEATQLRWGYRYGPDPSVAYAGDPHSTRGGFGCYAPVIVRALQKALPDGIKAVNLAGMSLNDLLMLYVMAGVPVAVWVTQDMSPIEEAYQWQSYDKSETFLYPVNQHCMVLCGFDLDGYYFMDPLATGAPVHYSWQETESCFTSLGSQAVALLQAS